MSNLTPAIQRFIELERKKNEYKKFYEELSKATEDLVKEIGINSYFQDVDGTVFKLVIPEGRFVYYEKFSYVRTRRGDEKRGDLSLKEAQEAGFEVK
jgi:transcriptional accessory protein Tex/SPT6